MIRCILLFLIFHSSIWSVHASQNISNWYSIDSILAITSLHKSIETVSRIGNRYVHFSQQYFADWSAFLQEYSLPLHSLTLVPTTDRTSIYRLRTQQYSLSCEISALQIILQRLGIQVTEDDIFLSIPQHPFIYNTGWIWWDPDKEFVGHYQWKQSRRTGYGIYAPPLAQYAQMFSLHTEMIDASDYIDNYDTEDHLEHLLKNLENANTHTLLWWDYCTNPVFEDGIFPRWWTLMIELFWLPGRNSCNSFLYNRNISWLTREGKRVQWLSWEHAFVLLGYIGTSENPTHIVVWDTYTGRHVYPYSEWMRKWSAMQYRSLVISSVR